VPITHRPPRDPSVAIQIPLRVKQHLGLDGARSWIVVSEINVFAWPGFDVRPIRYGANRVHYGWLPPKLFDQLIEKFRRLRATAKSEMTLRD
jgi:hypothetical protein